MYITFSEPARSIRFNLDLEVCPVIDFETASIINMVCDLLDLSFCLVSPIALCLVPVAITLNISYKYSLIYKLNS